MPQLDTATYRGQVTWLVIVFGGLYRVTRGDVLPKLSTIVKLRSKKRERTRGDASQYDGERTRVENAFSGRLVKAAGSSHTLLQDTMNEQNKWRNTQSVERSKTQRRLEANKMYRSHRMRSNIVRMYIDQLALSGKDKA
jgi:hypothetical protein